MSTSARLHVTEPKLKSGKLGIRDRSDKLAKIDRLRRSTNFQQLVPHGGCAGSNAVDKSETEGLMDRDVKYQ